MHALTSYWNILICVDRFLEGSLCSCRGISCEEPDGDWLSILLTRILKFILILLLFYVFIKNIYSNFYIIIILFFLSSYVLHFIKGKLIKERNKINIINNSLKSYLCYFICIWLYIYEATSLKKNKEKTYISVPLSLPL